MGKKYPFLVLVFALLLGLFFAGCENDWDLAPLTYPVSGVVQDEEGQGVEGVTLHFQGDYTGSTLTDEKGHWSALLEGVVTITPGKDGFSFEPVSQEVNRKKEDVNFVITGRSKFFLDLQLQEGGYVHAVPEGRNFQKGEELTLQAIPRMGWSFIQWQGDVQGAENPITLVMDRDQKLTPVFEKEGVEAAHYVFHYLDLSSGQAHLLLEEYQAKDTAAVILFPTAEAGEGYRVEGLQTAHGHVEAQDPISLGGVPHQDTEKGISKRREKEEEVLQNHPWASRRSPLLTTPEELELGQEEEFYFFSRDGSQKEVRVTLKGKGDTYLLWVDGTRELSPAWAWELGRIYEETIEPVVTELFGEKPQGGDFAVLDGVREQVNFLLTPQEEEGFFSSMDLYSRSEYDYSNERRMIYLPYPEEKEDLDGLPGLMAHHLQHMIFFNQRVQAERFHGDFWIQEGFSRLARDVTGYGFQEGFFTSQVDSFLGNPSGVFLQGGDSPIHQGMAYLFTRYLFHVYGPHILSVLSTSHEKAQEAQKDLTNLDFWEVFQDFALALLLHPVEEMEERFTLGEIHNPLGGIYLEPGSSWNQEEVKGWGIHYTMIGPGQGLDLTISVKGACEEGDFQMVVVERRGSP